MAWKMIESDVGQAVELRWSELLPVLLQLGFPEVLVGSLGVETWAVGGLSRLLVHHDAPGLLQVVEKEEYEKGVGEGKLERPTKGLVERDQVPCVVHAIGDMVYVAAIPGLVVVR